MPDTLSPIKPLGMARHCAAAGVFAVGSALVCLAGCSQPPAPAGQNPQGARGVDKGKASAAAAQAAKDAAADRSPETQEKRRAFVDHQLADGLFEKFVPEPAPAKLWVTPKFMLMSGDSQVGYVKCVYEFVYDGRKPEDFVALYQASSANEIARYSLEKGIYRP